MPQVTKSISLLVNRHTSACCSRSGEFQLDFTEHTLAWSVPSSTILQRRPLNATPPLDVKLPKRKQRASLFRRDRSRRSSNWLGSESTKELGGRGESERGADSGRLSAPRWTRGARQRYLSRADIDPVGYLIRSDRLNRVWIQNMEEGQGQVANLISNYLKFSKIFIPHKVI